MALEGARRGCDGAGLWGMLAYGQARARRAGGRVRGRFFRQGWKIAVRVGWVMASGDDAGDVLALLRKPVGATCANGERRVKVLSWPRVPTGDRPTRYPVVH